MFCLFPRTVAISPTVQTFLLQTVTANSVGIMDNAIVWNNGNTNASQNHSVHKNAMMIA